MVLAPDIPGHRVAGVLGTGGFAIVYRSWQVAVGREVAVKVDNRVLLSDRDRRRFVREVTAAGRLSGHPHVIDIYDAGTLGDGRPYLVMELCPAGSLNDALRRHGPMDAAAVRDIGIRISDALAAAHAAGVLHRDIKPANILINRYGMVGLSDFGLASIMAAEGEQSATRDALTPAFAPPESFRCLEPTVAADLYSLGATLYALLAGRPPRFPADAGSPGIATIIEFHGQPVDDVPGAPPELMAVLRQSLATDPAARPPDAAALRDALVTITPRPAGGAAGGAAGGVTRTARRAQPQPAGPPAGAVTRTVFRAQPETGGLVGPPSGGPVTPAPDGYRRPGRHAALVPADRAPPTASGAAPYGGAPAELGSSARTSSGSGSDGSSGSGSDGSSGPGADGISSGPGADGISSGPGADGISSGPGADGTATGMAPVTWPTRRRRLVTLSAAAAGLVLLIGAVTIGARVLAHGSGAATAGPISSRGRGSGLAGAAVPGAFGVPTVTSRCPAASVRAARAQCPQAPECWNGLVVISGDATAGSLPCARPHTWETFAIAILPAAVRTYDQAVVEANPSVRSVCSVPVLLTSRRGSARQIPQASWDIEVLPPDEAAFDSGARAYRCIARVLGGTDPSTSEFGR